LAPQYITAGFYNPNKKPLTTFFPPVNKPAQPAKSVATLPVFNECDPARQLTWNDYQSSPAGQTGALTASGIRVVNSFGQNWFQAFFDPAGSFVSAWNKTPADNSVNGCQNAIDRVTSQVQAHEKASPRISSLGPVCAASILPQPVEVNNVAEVSTKFAPECARSRVADSERLLRHEQLHFAISCVLAKKANELVLKGIDFMLVYTGVVDLYNKINLNNGSGDGDYDAQTNHGCDQAKQNEWQTRVNNGLQDYRIPTVGDFIPRNGKNAG